MVIAAAPTEAAHELTQEAADLTVAELTEPVVRWDGQPDRS